MNLEKNKIDKQTLGELVSKETEENILIQEQITQIKTREEWLKLLEQYGLDTKEREENSGRFKFLKSWHHLTREQKEEVKEKFPIIVEKIENRSWKDDGKIDFSWQYFFVDKNGEILGTEDVFDDAVGSPSDIYMIKEDGKIQKYFVNIEESDDEENEQ